MSKTIAIDILDASSVDAAVREIQEYAKWVQTKAEALAKRLAAYGLTQVRIGYNAAVYDEDKHIEVSVANRGDNTYVITAEGRDVLFLEFGAGVRYGDGHPLNGDLGMGPGTYPGQTHVPEPGFWWYTGEDGESHFSVGNAPSMVMYLTGMELEREVERIAMEVFSP